MVKKLWDLFIQMNFKKLFFNLPYKKMENNFLKLLQTILNDFIPKNKVDCFLELMNEYGLKSSSFKYFIAEQEPKSNRHKIPIDELRKRLFSNLTYVETPKLVINNPTDEKEIITKCDAIVNKILYVNKKNKKYYYHLGKYLSLLKSHFVLKDTIDNFNMFIDERYKIKLSTLHKYMKFCVLCESFPELYYCDLAFTDIMENVPEIKKILSGEKS